MSLGPRPPYFSLGESYWAPWARGRRLDLRHLKDGYVTELKYDAPLSNSFNRGYLASRLADFADQEIVSFAVLGVSLKAEPQQQLTILKHLLTLQGHVEEVRQDVLGLKEHGWVEEFDHPPFLPSRCNGK